MKGTMSFSQVIQYALALEPSDLDSWVRQNYVGIQPSKDLHDAHYDAYVHEMDCRQIVQIIKVYCKGLYIR